MHQLGFSSLSSSSLAPRVEEEGLIVHLAAVQPRNSEMLGHPAVKEEVVDCRYELAPGDTRAVPALEFDLFVGE